MAWRQNTGGGGVCRYFLGNKNCLNRTSQAQEGFPGPKVFYERRCSH